MLSVQNGDVLMVSVTQRIKVVKQPRGGYVNPRTLDVVQRDDGLTLHADENIHASLTGAVVDYLSRVAGGTLPGDAFKVSLAGASVLDAAGVFDVISIEDLNVRGMTSAARGKGRKAKAGLNRGIMQNSFGELRQMLEYKADWYGGEVVAIDRYFPSTKLCSDCGTVTESKPLSVRFWKCDCGTAHDRDVNAAKNINAAGLAVYACGDGVRPAKKPLASSAGSRR